MLCFLVDSEYNGEPFHAERQEKGVPPRVEQEHAMLAGKYTIIMYLYLI